VGSAVAQTPVNERGCTLFASNLDGTNEVVWSCAKLGLVANDDIDALVVYGAGSLPHTALFSVTQASVGATDTDVNAESSKGHAADIFLSQGDNDNTRHVSARSLGLLADDDVDALAIRSAGVPAETWLPPPPPFVDPVPGAPEACFPSLIELVPNPTATSPQSFSDPTFQPRVARPPARIRRHGTRLRRFTTADATRNNALMPCNALPTTPPAQLADTVVQTFCDVAIPPSEFRAGDYFITVVETEENITFTDFYNIQFAVVADVDGAAANNYKAQAPYTKDTFDGADEALQLRRQNGPLEVRSERISQSPFVKLTNVPDRIVKFGRAYLFFKIVPDGAPVPRARITFFGADSDYGLKGGDWTMSNVNAVGETMLAPLDERCP
jgi:hypothetical protein